LSHNTFGHLFRVTTWGESHGAAIGCVVDGCPPRIPLTEADIQPWLDRRRPGQSKYTTQRQEPDEVRILSGTLDGLTTGTPIALEIQNVDQRSRDYGAIAQQSVPKLFAAGLIPGVALTLLYMAVALVVANRSSDRAPSAPPATMRQRVGALRGPWQFLTLFVVTIGGIYAGIFSPTEAASIGALGAILLGLVGRRLRLRELVKTVETAVVTSCTLYVIIIGANIFAYFMVQTQLPALIADQARALHLPGLVVMLLVILAYILMGCFLEAIGMILITVPVFLPLIVAYGYDPTWFAIIVVIVVELGLIHPPIGMNLFVIQAQAPDIKTLAIYRGILPFLVAPFLLIALLFAFPQLALWLPAWLYG